MQVSFARYDILFKVHRYSGMRDNFLKLLMWILWHFGFFRELFSVVKRPLQMDSSILKITFIYTIDTQCNTLVDWEVVQQFI